MEPWTAIASGSSPPTGRVQAVHRHKLAMLAVVLVAGGVSIATSLPRVSDEKRGEIELKDNDVLAKRFDVSVHAEARTRGSK